MGREKWSIYTDEVFTEMYRIAIFIEGVRSRVCIRIIRDASTQRLLLTESVIDAASLYQVESIRREYSILALYGGNGFTEEHASSIKGLKNLEEIILMLDGDEAGRKGTDFLSKKLLGLRSDVKISYVSMLEGEDVNSLLESHAPSVYTHLLENRKAVNTSFFSLEKSNEEKSVEKKKQPSKGKLDTSNPSYLVYTRESLRYTLLGGVNVKELDKLRVTIKLEVLGAENSYYSLRHNLDLYNDDQLTKLIRKASERLEVSSRSLQYGLSGLIDAVEKWRSENRVGEELQLEKRVLTADRIKAARAYLKKEKLLRRTSDDIGKSGIIGEYKNRMIVYLSFTSRLRAMPLHVITFGPSGSGKTYVLEKVSELMPAEDVLQFTALTENALYYLNGGDVSGKILICEDLDGAESNMYNMRELLSKREISKLVTTKDNKGKLDTVRMHLKGPVALGSTTTRDRLYEDNANRALLISPDSSVDQSERIQAYQRRVSSGRVNKQEERKWKEFFKDVQSVLKPVAVRNPYAEDLRIPSSCFKPLRTNAHYLHFIETITFYHQYQRERKICPITKTEYIETTLEDIEAANALLEEVLLIKADDLRSKQCRSFYNRLEQWLSERQAKSFKSGELVKALRVPSRTVNYNLSQLRQYGYLKVLGGNRYRGGLEYELARVGDYERLSEGVKSSLSTVLEGLREKVNGAVGK